MIVAFVVEGISDLTNGAGKLLGRNVLLAYINTLIGGFIATLGVALVAAPGAPGGAIMSALPFMTIVSIDPTGTIGNLLISLYITEDSFGTTANVSGDNAIALVIDKVYRDYMLEEDAVD